MPALPETLRIVRDDLPSGQFDVIIKCPYYGDYRKAKKLYPNQTDAQGRFKSPGYSVEELLFCQQIVDVQDANGNSVLNREPKDVIDKLAMFTIPDRQTLLSIFLEVFWLGVEKARSGRALANEYLLAPGLTYSIKREDFPSRSFGITYNAPNAGVQMAADRRYQGAQEQGCSLEEFLFAMCVTEIEGKPIEAPKDTISLLDNWTIADVQFGNLVFINQFTLDDSGVEKAKDAGKRYLASFGTADSEPAVMKARMPKAATEAAV